MNKFITTKRPIKVADKTDEKAEGKPQPITPKLTPTPRERRALRREAALAEADAAVELRNAPKKKVKVELKD